MDAWLKEKGVDRTIRDLRSNVQLYSESGPLLLELFKSELGLSPSQRADIGEAQFRRKLEPSQKVEATACVLEQLSASPDKQAPYVLRLARLLSEAALVSGILVPNVAPSKTREIGEMLLNKDYGKTREYFTYALRRIGTPEAISYLEQAARDPEVAPFALRALALLRPDRQSNCANKPLKTIRALTNAEIRRTLSVLESQANLDQEFHVVDKWLQNHGVCQGMLSIYDDPSLAPDCVSELLDLLETKLSMHMAVVVFHSIFSRKRGIPLQRRAVETLLRVIKQNCGNQDAFLWSGLVLNPLANNVEKSRVHEIGTLLFDQGYGAIRRQFAYVLYKIGTPEAIPYLIRAVKDPEPTVCGWAVDALAKLRVPDAEALCKEALERSDLQTETRENVSRIYSKLRRRQKRKTTVPSHVTNLPVPDNLEEWSANIDSDWLPKILRVVQRFVPHFDKTAISEVRKEADELSPGQTVWFRFSVNDTDLWLEIFCNDEDAVDFYIFGFPQLIEKFGDAAGEVLDQLESSQKS